MENEEFESLCKLFKDNTKAALTCSESLLCFDRFPTIDKFIEHYKQNSSVSYCTKCWTTETIVVHCNDCHYCQAETMCMECFLNGNHKGHNIRFVRSKQGSCSCGNYNMMKREGCCPKHSNKDENPHKTSLDKELRKKCLSVFNAAVHNIEYFIVYRKDLFILVLDWLTMFININEGFRRLVSIATASTVGAIINNFDLNSKEINTKILNFYLSVMGDDNFTKVCAKYVLECHVETAKKMWRLTNFGKGIENMAPLYEYSEFMYNDIMIQILLDSFEIPWIESVFSMLAFYKQTLDEYPSAYRKFEKSCLISSLKCEIQLTKTALSQKSQTKYIQTFFDKMVDFVSPFADLPVITLKYAEELNHTILLTHFINALADAIVNLKKTEAKINPTSLYKALSRFVNSLNPTEEFYDCQICNAKMSPSQPLQCILSAITRNPSDFRQNLIDAAAVAKLPLIDYCSALIVYSTRLFAFHCSQSSNELKNFSPVMTIIVNDLHTEGHFMTRFIPLFRLIQGCIGAADDKEGIIKMIALSFWMFHRCAEPTGVSFIRFGFLHLISMLLTSRASLEVNEDDLARSMIHLCAAVEDGISPTKIISAVRIDGYPESKIVKHTRELLQVSIADNEHVLKVRDIQSVNVFVPMCSCNDALNIIMKQSGDGNWLVNFPDIISGIPNLDFEGALRTKALTAALFYVAYDGLSSDKLRSMETLNIILNLLIKRSRIEEHSEVKKESYKVILVENPSELMDVMPTEFMDVMWTPIGISGEEPITFVDIIMKYSEQLGKNALLRMNIGFEPPPTQKDKRKECHLKALALKERILAEFKQFQNHFQFGCSHINNESIDRCQYCHNERDDIYGYPISSYLSCLPSFLECAMHRLKKPFLMTFGMHLCPHMVHIGCCTQDVFECPTDRAQRNAVLPIFPDVIPEFDERLFAASEKFKQRLFDFSLGPNAEIDTPYEVILHSLVDILILSDIRLRAFPACLDRQNVPLLLRNLFLMLSAMEKWGKLTMKQKPEDWSPLKCVVVAALKNNRDPAGAAVSKMKEIIGGLEPIFTLEFARRVALFCHFCAKQSLCDRMLKAIDWDIVLSAASLSERYGIELTDRPLPSFSFGDLPPYFHLFAAPPWNLPIERTDVTYLLCLLTKRVLEITEGSLCKVIKDHIRERCFGNPTIFLVLTGAHASGLFLCAPSFKWINEIPPLYVDLIGNSDINLENGCVLHLNRERYQLYADKYLSGEWVDFIKMQDA